MKRYHYTFAVRSIVEVDADSPYEAFERVAELRVDVGESEVELELEEPNTPVSHDPFSQHNHNA